MSGYEPSDTSVTRRDFLTRTVITAAGAAAGVLGVRRPDTASAQQARRRPQRVALIGVDHYHATSTPNYLRILKSQNLDIFGSSRKKVGKSQGIMST